jgi:Restriction endonuclease BglII
LLRIAEYYSHQNGLEHILVHKSSLWDEIRYVIASVDAESYRLRDAQKQQIYGKSFYDPADFNTALNTAFASMGWIGSPKQALDTADQQVIHSSKDFPTDFVKDRIAIEVQFGKYAFVAYDLFVKHMAFYVGDIIDVGIEILPMKELQAQMSSGPSYYEGELYNLIRQGRGIPAVPLVLVGVAP